MSPHTARNRFGSKHAGLHEPSLLSIFRSNPRHSLAADLSSIYLEGTDAEVEERSYRSLFPVVKQLVQLYKAHPELEKLAEFRIACAVCSDLVHFRGWEPLLIHAQKFWKRFPLQHLGYHRALKEAFIVEDFSLLPADPVAWPLVLLVENGGLTFDGSLRRWKGLQGVDVPGNIKGIEIEEVLAVYKNGNGDRRDVIVFPASEVGLVDSKKLTEIFEKASKSGEPLNLRIESLQTPENRCDSVPACGRKNTPENSKAEYHDKTDNVTEPTTSGSGFDYDNHRPLGTSATMKEIKEKGRVDSVRCKWANGLAGCREYCACGYSWPFQKSRKVGRPTTFRARMRICYFRTEKIPPSAK